MQRIALTLCAGFVGLAILVLASPSLATLNGCAAAKKLCVAKKAAALLKCHSKNEKPPMGLSALKFAACIQTAKDKFDGGADPSKGCFARAQAKFPGGCVSTLDTEPVEAKVDSFVDDIVCTLDPAGGTCPATPTPTPTGTPTTPTPTPTGCLGPGQPCTSDAVCCSHSCNIFGMTCF